MRFLEEAKKDHRKIGKELDLFSFHEEGGFLFGMLKAALFLNPLLIICEPKIKRGYQEIKTPPILNDGLWKKVVTGIITKNMYFTQIDERSFAVKPMNCPGGCWF